MGKVAKWETIRESVTRKDLSAARIRTWDQRIMSRSSRIPLDASALLVSASETTSKKEQYYPIVRRIPDLISIPVTAASPSVLGALPPIRSGL